MSEKEQGFWNSAARERLRAAVDAAGQHSKVASDVGLSAANLSHMLNRDNEPRLSRLTKLCRHLGVSVDYVLTGQSQGEMSAIDPEMMRIPVHDITASAGGGAVAIDREDTDVFWPFPVEMLSELAVRLDKLHLLSVRGDSMTPTLNDGDTVMIDRSRTDWVDGLYVARFYDDLFVKRVQFEGRQVRLVSDNGNYRTIEIDRENESDVAALELVGRVVWKAGFI